MRGGERDREVRKWWGIRGSKEVGEGWRGEKANSYFFHEAERDTLFQGKTQGQPSKAKSMNYVAQMVKDPSAMWETRV